jgi:hypothetical protein
MLSRADNILQSLQDYVAAFLDANGFAGKYVFEDEYPSDRQTPLRSNIVVMSHDSSFGAENVELGGPLTEEPMTFLVDVLGKSARYGQNIASLIKQKLESGEPIPVQDYSTASASTVDYIPYVDSALHQRIRFQDPAPWQQFWNTVAFTIRYEYNREYLG